MRRHAFPFVLLIALSGLAAWFLNPPSKSAAGHSLRFLAAPSPAPSAPAASLRPLSVDAPLRASDTAASADLGTTATRHGIIASSWEHDTRPAQGAFRAWTRRYLLAPPADRDALVDEGVRLAEVRRAELAALIIEDPRAALASAVPAVVRARLPEAILARLEKRVSARGELALNAVTPAPGAPAPAEPYFRTALIEGTEYRAHVYGQRALEATYPDTALVGIAIDGLLAVADSPVRLLEPGETVPPDAPRVGSCAACAAAAVSAPGIAYEYAGAIGVAADAAHLDADLAALEADNQPGTGSVLGRPSQSWTHGPKKILIIRAVFADTPGAADDQSVGLAESAAVQRFNGADGVGDFFARSSFGKTTLVVAPAVNGDSPDVTPVLRLPRTGSSYATTNSGDNASLHLDARRAAAAAGFALDAYDRVGVVFPSLAEIPSSKITYGGLAQVVGPNFWVNGAYTFRIVAHELGHTYGLRHANLWKVADGDPASESGVSVEYGDPFDIMGGGEFFSSIDDIGPWGKSLLRWIPDDAVSLAESGGTYRVHRSDSASADLSLPRALKIVRDPTRDYWIGYKRATSHAALNSGAYVLWGYNSLRQGDLLDLNTPGDDAEDAPLALGSTFDDVAAGITLTPVAQGGSGADEWLDVQVSFRPRVQWLDARLAADEQLGVAVLTLRRSASSAGAVSVAYATEAGDASPGVDYEHRSGTVSWADGDTADKTVAIPLVADSLVEGAETFLVRLSSVSGGVRVGDAVATVTIADPGARDASFAADHINSTVFRAVSDPSGGIVLGGAFSRISSETRGGVARLLPDGRLDTEFAAGAGASLDGSAAIVRDLARQPDGRFLVLGDFDAYDGVPRDGFARLMPDGTIDLGFVPPAANGDIYAALPLPDGRILVAGDFTQIGGKARRHLARLLPDGRLDTSFVGPAFASASWSRVESLARQPDGKILVGGVFYFTGAATLRSGLCRLLPDGALDSTFNGVGHGAHLAGETTSLESVNRIVVQPDGRILIAGTFTAYNNTTRKGFARLAANGALEAGFAPAFDDAPAAMLFLPGGDIIVAGDFTAVGGIASPGLARLSSAGAPDAAFAAAGAPSTSVFDLALSADGRVVTAGHPATFQEGGFTRPVWRLLPGLAGTAGTVAFVADSRVAAEGASTVLTVHRKGGAHGAIRVGYATAQHNASNTATPGSDYVAASGFLSWEDGDDSPRQITIPIAADESDDDGETFTVRLGEPLLGGVALGERNQAVVTIGSAHVSTQTIDFVSPASRVFGSGPVTLDASASSGLPVVFELVSGPATIDGATLTPNGAGRIVVRATQAGDETFAPAAPVEVSFEIAKAVLTAKPADHRRLVGTANPPLTVTYSGLRGSDTADDLDKAPRARVSATKKSRPGEYPITLVGGTDANYDFAFNFGVLRVVGFGGRYESLLVAPEGGGALGKLDIVVSATSPGYSGVLDLGEQIAPIPFKGVLSLDPLLDDADPSDEDRASGSWSSAAAAPRDFRVEVNVGLSGCVVAVYRGGVLIAEGQGPKNHSPPPKTAVAWAGAHTAWFEPLAPLDSSDTRALPAGVGHAAFKVAASGLLKLAPAALPDGSKFTATLRPDASGVYRFFARPHGKRPHSFIVGELDVAGGTTEDFVWRKAEKAGAPPDASLRAGFTLAGRASSAPWTPPRAAKASVPALTLAQLLGLMPEAGGAFDVILAGADLGQSAAALPTEFVLDPASSRIAFRDPALPNPQKFSLSFVAKTGAFRGAFNLSDTITIPGKPDARRSRKVVFSGVLRQASDDEPGNEFGLGFFLLKPLDAGAESQPGGVRIAIPSP